MIHYFFPRSFILAICALLSFSITAQIPIKGVVTDATSGEPLIGATITVDDSSSGTITDLNGDYVIMTDSTSQFLNISYIGFKSIDIEIDNQTQINVALESGALLDEVVVVGYGEQSRNCLLYTSPSPRDATLSRMPSSA